MKPHKENPIVTDSQIEYARQYLADLPSVKVPPPVKGRWRAQKRKPGTP